MSDYEGDEEDCDFLEGFHLTTFLHKGKVWPSGRISWEEESKQIGETEAWDRDDMNAKISEINPGAMLFHQDGGPAFRVEVVAHPTMDGMFMGPHEHFQFVPERIDDAGNWMPWKRDLAQAWEQKRNFDDVSVRFTDEETKLLRGLRGRPLQSEITRILSGRLAEVELLCGHLINPGTRYTFDEGSLTIEDTVLRDERTGFISGNYTASMYAGCSGLDDIADDREFRFDLVVNLARTVATVSCEMLNFEPEPDET